MDQINWYFKELEREKLEKELAEKNKSVEPKIENGKN